MQGTLGLSRRPAVFSPDQCRFFRSKTSLTQRNTKANQNYGTLPGQSCLLRELPVSCPGRCLTTCHLLRNVSIRLQLRPGNHGLRAAQHLHALELSSGPRLSSPAVPLFGFCPAAHQRKPRKPTRFWFFNRYPFRERARCQRGAHGWRKRGHTCCHCG